MVKTRKKIVEEKLLRLDLGTGKGRGKPEGYLGVDIVKGEGVDIVHDLRKRWPWVNASVDAVNCEYLIHYLAAGERVHFANELYRVLKPDASALIKVPHWCSTKAYGDVRVQWPPVCEMWFFMLNKEFRSAQNCDDTTGYKCDFTNTLAYGLHPAIIPRTEEYRQNAVAFYKDAAQDIIVTLTKR